MATQTKVIGPISAYAIAVQEGYTGSKSEWAAEIGNAQANAAIAQEAADRAQSLTESLPEDFDDVVENFAPLYSDLTLPASAGTYCTHNGILYKANTTIASGEAWTQGHWTKVDVGGEVSDLKSAMSDISEISNLFDPNTIMSNARITTTGGYIEETDAFTSANIPVIVGVTYHKNSPTIDAYHRMATYDSDNQNKRVISDSNDVTIESGEVAVRFCGTMEELETARFGSFTAVDLVARAEIANQTITVVPAEDADPQSAIVVPVFSEIKGENLANPNDAVYGSWYNPASGALVSNQYTTEYQAWKAVVSGLSKISVRVEFDSGIRKFYSYSFVNASGTLVQASTTVNQSITSPYTLLDITVPANSKEFRFNIQYGTISKTRVAVYSGSTAASYEPYNYEIYSAYVTSGLMKQNAADIATLKEEKAYCNIVMPEKIYAVIGDTLQLYYETFIDADIDNLIVSVSCPKGKNYPRYYEYTPASGDAGTYSMNVAVFDKSGNRLGGASASLVVVAASNPSSSKNVLMVGDSLMQSGQIPIEASRRIKGTAGTATSPAALSLTNINFVGRKKNSGETVGWEGTGGYTYNSYITAGTTNVRFTVTGANNINIGDIYTVNSFKLIIREINVTEGAGNILFAFDSSTPYSSSFDNTSASGTLTRSSGNGQASITYSAWSKESGQPFWNASTNQFDIVTYRDTYCGGHIDVMCVLLGVNSLITRTTFESLDAVIPTIKTFLDNVHTQLPSTKIVISTLPLSSPNGGLAANYGASSSSGECNSNGFWHKIFALNAELIEIGKLSAYSGFVTVVGSHMQFDPDYGYPTTTKAVNTRTTETETLQTNGVHPNNNGYWQIADALGFRSVISVIAG